LRRDINVKAGSVIIPASTFPRSTAANAVAGVANDRDT
jgi:hypothetical protein